jgi:uncharacterized membrane protein YdjX (TVP38/TMEM64 family)
MKPQQRLLIIRLLVLAGVIGLTAVLLIYRDKIKDFAALGLPGVFLVNLFSSATVLIPVPGVVFTSAMGAVFHPLGVAFAAGSGAALGEFSGYLAGFSGRAVVEKVKWHERVENWMKRFGDVTILVLAIIPNPLFDMAGITAGALKMPWYRFLVWCWMGKILKMIAFAYGGAYLAKWFVP